MIEPNATRREFGRSVMGLTAGAFAAEAAADDKRKEDPTTPKALTDADRANQEMIAISEALTEVARARYGKYLSKDQLREVFFAIIRTQGAAQRLRKFELQNGDEPAVIFRA